MFLENLTVFLRFSSAEKKKKKTTQANRKESKKLSIGLTQSLEAEAIVLFVRHFCPVPKPHANLFL